VDQITPWWRSVDTQRSGKEPTEPPAMTLPKSIPWPLD